MLHFFADWCGMVGAHPVLQQQPVECVLETIFPHLMISPKRNKSGTWDPPRFREGKKLRLRLEKHIKKVVRCYCNRLFLDSGAYTIQAYSGTRWGESGINFRLSNNRAYHDRRAAFSEFFADLANVDRFYHLYQHEVVPTLWDELFVYAEVDIQELLGTEKVFDWRQEALDLGYAEKMLITWKESTDEPLEDWFKTWKDWPSKYLALAIRDPEYMKEAHMLAYRNGWRTHGFGVSDPMFAFKYPMYSMDSTRWKAPAVWGEITLWEPNKRNLRHVPTSPKKDAWAKFIKNGEHPRLIMGLPMSTNYDGTPNPEGIEKLLRIQTQHLERFAQEVTYWWKKRGVTY